MEAKAQQWKNEKHICERCGIIMETKYGSGRFCSHECSHRREQSEETKQKIRNATILNYQQGLHNSKQIHDEAVKRYDDNPKRCEICGQALPYEKREQHTCSKDCAYKLLSQKSSAAAQRMGGNLNPYGVRGTAKYGTYKGIHCDSSWELAYVMYCLDHDIKVERNNDGFEYTYNDEQHLYFPDFIVDGTYIEVKNFDNEQVQCKINQFPKDKQLKVLFKPDMKQYINYCTKTYGKNYAELYDKDKPSWMDRKSRENKKSA